MCGMKLVAFLSFLHKWVSNSLCIHGAATVNYHLSKSEDLYLKDTLKYAFQWMEDICGFSLNLNQYLWMSKFD